MRSLQSVILFLAVSGCSSLPEQEPIIADVPEVSERHTPTLSPAPRPVSKTETGSRDGNRLRDCVTESCRINCAPSVPQRNKPKWCSNFKEAVVEKPPKVSADLVPKQSRKLFDIDPNRHAAFVNYDGAVLHLYDAYAFLAGSSSRYSDERSRRVPLWWPLHFH
jgi:hypothetical protein